jgi:hypothetical protein
MREHPNLTDEGLAKAREIQSSALLFPADWSILARSPAQRVWDQLRELFSISSEPENRIGPALARPHWHAT